MFRTIPPNPPPPTNEDCKKLNAADDAVIATSKSCVANPSPWNHSVGVFGALGQVAHGGDILYLAKSLQKVCDVAIGL